MMVFVVPLQPWLFQVDPYPDESFGHFLGRFRRANHLSCSHLSSMIGLHSHTVSYWQAPSRQRIPSLTALKMLAELMGVDVARLRLMLMPDGTRLYFRTRLCAHCYGELPIHKLTWQVANIDACDRHQCQLLFACPRCGTDFRLPAYWEVGQCEHCWLPFQEMAGDQRPIEIDPS